jgi:hypothetical protein
VQKSFLVWVGGCGRGLLHNNLILESPRVFLYRKREAKRESEREENSTIYVYIPICGRTASSEGALG